MNHSHWSYKLTNLAIINQLQIPQDLIHASVQAELRLAMCRNLSALASKLGFAETPMSKVFRHGLLVTASTSLPSSLSETVLLSKTLSSSWRPCLCKGYGGDGKKGMSQLPTVLCCKYSAHQSHEIPIFHGINHHFPIVFPMVSWIKPSIFAMIFWHLDPPKIRGMMALRSA